MYRVRCLHDPESQPAAAGDVADVCVVGQDGADMVASVPDPTVTRVEMSVTTTPVRVESYLPADYRIGFCGHGALAAAYVAFDRLMPESTELRCCNHARSWTAVRRNDPAYPVALRFARPMYREIPPIDGLSQVLGGQYQRLAELGDAHEYLLVQFADERRVGGLQPDYPALSALTGRAVIATARARHDDRYTVVFRYFAPQYGTPEGGATGSAAVQLAAWWGEDLQDDSFVARQLSPSGAVLRVQLLNSQVELSGRVAYDG
jgi:predicted PhzF superfamily epimerase YddE/YHI9